MAKRKKFDLTHLVHAGYLKNGEKLLFVSDPKKYCTIFKLPNGEFKVKDSEGITFTMHAFAQQCLGTEPPDHASRWLRTEAGKTLYEIWSNESYEEAA